MLWGLLHSGSAPIGVDIAPDAVRLFQLRSTRGLLRGVGAASIEIDRPMRDADPVGRIESVLDKLRQRIDDAGFRGRRCVVGVDPDVYRVRSLRQPRMPEADADKAVRLEGAERLEFDADQEVELGWLRAGDVRQGEDVREEIILVGAARRDMESLVDAVTATGLRPIALEPSFLSAARCHSRFHRRDADRGRVRLLLDVGWRRSSVMVLRGVDVSFLKHVDIGGRDFERVASDRLEMEPDVVAELRRERLRRPEDAQPEDARVERVIFDAVRPLMEQLADEINRCLRYFSVTFRAARPEVLTLCGSEAGEPGLGEQLRDTLQIPIEVARPLDSVRLPESLPAHARRAVAPEWSSAVGLALRGDLADVRRESRRAATESEPEITERRAAA